MGSHPIPNFESKHLAQMFHGRDGLCENIVKLREDIAGTSKGGLDIETICKVLRSADRQIIDLSLQHDGESTSLLHLAVSRGSLPILRALLNAKNAVGWQESLRCHDVQSGGRTDAEGEMKPTPFMLACENPRNIALVKALLKDSRITTMSYKLRDRHPNMPEVFQELMYCHPSLVPVLANPLHGKVDVNMKIGNVGILHRCIRDFQDRLRKYLRYLFYFVTIVIRFPSVSFER